MGLGDAGDRFADPEHVYASDLDLFGKGSLFQLAANARTEAGLKTLADWFLQPAGRTEVVDRQGAVAELVDRLQLREELALLGDDVQSEVHVAALARWAAGAPIHFPPPLRPVAAILAVAALGSIVAFFGQMLPLSALLAVLAFNMLVRYGYRARVRAVLSVASQLGTGLRILALALERFQREQVTSPRLVSLLSQLKAGGEQASDRILELQRWLDWKDSGDHVLVRILQPVLLWDEQIAMGIESWRQRFGKSLPIWVRAIAELEALSSLATLAYEHPGWSFPQLSDSPAAVFLGRDLRHPLLPSASSVPNDVEFREPVRVFIVSGSNMSGKSTLLRTVGLNAVLALAGGPVAASDLVLSCLQVAASIRVADSLLDHRSRFMAEVLRIGRAILLAQTDRPVLFLLDEILSGTNSRDRQIGASAVVRKLVDSCAIGLITTHDLALAGIEEELGGRAANVSFEDDFVGGEMTFDYKLKPGIVKRSNALELMRFAGIEV